MDLKEENRKLREVCDKQMKLLEKDNVKFVVMEQVDSLALGKWANDNWAYGKELKWILYRLRPLPR